MPPRPDAKPVSSPPANSRGAPSSQNELVWTLRRFLYLSRYWTTPLGAPVPIPDEDRNSVRAFALFLIVGLTFAIRADPSGGTYAAITALAGVIAAVMSGVLAALSEQFNLRIKDQLLISGYASTIAVMFLFIAVDQFLSGIQWYESLCEEIGKTLATTILAAIISYGLLLLKAFVVDRHPVTALSLLHAAIMVAFSGAIVFFISILSTPLFNLILGWLR